MTAKHKTNRPTSSGCLGSSNRVKKGGKTPLFAQFHKPYETPSKSVKTAFYAKPLSLAPCAKSSIAASTRESFAFSRSANASIAWVLESLCL